jgi:hypothetical protein
LLPFLLFWKTTNTRPRCVYDASESERKKVAGERCDPRQEQEDEKFLEAFSHRESVPTHLSRESCCCQLVDKCKRHFQRRYLSAGSENHFFPSSFVLASHSWTHKNRCFSLLLDVGQMYVTRSSSMCLRTSRAKGNGQRLKDSFARSLTLSKLRKLFVY